MGTNAPAPSLDELIALDDAISRALRRVPAYESISEAAARVLASPKGDPAWRVAAAILREGSSPWARMRRAARAARRLERVR